MIPGVVASRRVAGGGGGGGDPYWANVVALLHFNGADGSVVFPDEKAVVWTPVGNAKISTTQAKFGGSSLALDGAGSWASAVSPGFAFGTGDFTIEAWARFSGASGNRFLWGHHTGWGLYVNGTQALVFNGSANVISSATAASGGAWSHVAVTRVAGVLRAFWSGVQFGVSVPNTTDFNTQNFRIGAQTSGGGAMVGHVDDFRITAGVGRYTSNFSPPSSPFPNIVA